MVYGHQNSGTMYRPAIKFHLSVLVLGIMLARLQIAALAEVYSNRRRSEIQKNIKYKIILHLCRRTEFSRLLLLCVGGVKVIY